MQPRLRRGLLHPASIGDYVWKDLNANGIQETGEPGIENALVTLTGTDGQGNPVTLTTLTDANGYYLFDNLHPGMYKLTFATPAGCDAATYVNQGADDTIDSDADPAMGGMTTTTTLISGEHDPTWDAGFYSYASIGDYVWEDYSADGEQDAGEPGIQGVIVMLTGTTGNGTAVMLQTTTDATGHYLFDNLVPGTYKLKFTTPTGYILTLQDTPSGNDAADSDPDPVMGMTTPTVLVSGEDDLTWDAGYYTTDYGDLPNTYGTLNGVSDGAYHVLNPNLLLGSCADAELNGQPEAMAGAMTGGDDNNAGTPVKGTCTTGTDDENGIKFITPLVQGSQACVEVSAINTSGAPAYLQGWIDFNGDGDVLDNGEELVLTNGGIVPNGGVNNVKYCFMVPDWATFQNGAAFARFRLSPQGGLTPLGQAIGGEVEDYKVTVGKIGNLVWNDANFNGIQNAGETGIADVNVKLTWAGPDGNINTAADNVDYTTTTNLGGLYYFCGVINGTYKITVLTPAMMTPTKADQGGNNVLDSDGPVVGMDLTMVMETFTIADVNNMPVGENGLGDQGSIMGYADAQIDETHDFGFAFLDYGDLPQEALGQQYNTTMAENGAVHVTTPKLTLGNCVDAERDGQPDDDAGVYDYLTTDSGDGDDGIQGYDIDAQDCVGNTFGVVSAGSYLCENKLIVRQINAQGEYVYYVVNGDFSPAITAAGGLANVIGKEVIITSPATTGAYGGNTNALIACLAQQDGVTADLVNIGGTATINFSCFDQNQVCEDDENGVRFATPLVPTYEACIRVTAQNATGAPAYLQGWIDWNGNKQLEAGEALVFTNGGVVPSGGVIDAPYCFVVPADAHFNDGRVYARFRLSPTGGLGPDGPDKYGAASMPLGEVEDYIEEVGKVGNLVWNDTNFDGLQGNPADEPGMNGVQIQLMWAGPDGDITTMADNLTYVQTTSTINGKNGLYYFCGLIDGTYKLTAATPTDFVPTLINQGNDDHLDADDFVNGDIFNWPDVANLVLNEHGVSDMPGMIPNFPDAHDDQTHDMGYVALDFGDNPDTYTTTLPNGAHHTITPGLYLGMGVDSEPNGQPDAESGVVPPGGDDNDPSTYNVGMVPASGDDEDGVRILTPLIPGYEACLEIKTTVQAPHTGAFLSAWIDFDGNGVYDASEKVTFTTINGAAVNSSAPAIPQGQLTRKYCFNVPANATFQGGAANMRFRLSKTANMNPTGLVVFGEVEDYWQPLAIVGNYAWMDSDIEGDQDLAEMMLASVPVQLRWFGEDAAFGTADDRLYNTTTDALGVYLYRGLIPGGYRITPLKYTGVNNPDNVQPVNKVLTIPNLPPNDNIDSDANPFIPVTIPDLITNFLPVNEDGLKDNNGLNGFPDKNENLSLDMGFINKPAIAASLGIQGVAKASSGTCGHFDVIMDLCIKNTGEIPLNMLTANLDLGSSNAFGSMFLGFVTGGQPQIISSTAQQDPALNTAYNGTSITNLFSGPSGLLWPGEQVCIRMRFELNPDAPGAPSAPDVQAQVSAKAVNFQGVPVPDFFNNGAQYMVMDLSDDGFDPMSNNPYAPGDTGGYDDPTPLTNCWDISQPLVQNDLVHISIDSSCQVLVLASMVLEGEADNCTEETYPLGGYYTVKIKTQQGVLVPNPVPASYLGQTLIVEIEHVVSCNKTWGHIVLEDKLAPSLTCPGDVTIACSESTDVSHTGNVGIHDCTATTTQIDDEVVNNGDCSDPRQIITRTFIVTDAWGNQSTCSQIITVLPFDLDDVIFPDDITIDCEDLYNNPNATAPANTGNPSINGASITGSVLCDSKVNYTDTYYEGCEGTFTILRAWSVLSDCLPVGPNNPVSHTQRIEVEDVHGPQFVCPPAVTVSTDPFNCCATAALPDMIVSEGCSNISDLQAKVTGTNPANGNIITFTVPGYLTDFPGNNYWLPDTLAVFDYTSCLPLGDYTVRYTASDQCGNVSTCQFVLTVADLVPPVVACQEVTQVSIGAGGQVEVLASSFDSDTYDNCCLDSLLVRRMGTICGDTIPDDFGPSVFFCCDDISDTVQVIMRATDCHGNHNECMIQVLVEDKVKPVCNAPANTTVSCENFDPSLWVYGYATGQDNCCMDTITVQNNYSLFDTVCNRGTITRTFRAYDCAGQSSQCTQRVFVNYEQDYFVRFPNDVIVTVCDGTGNFGEPTFFGEDCELLGVTFQDAVFTVVPDACFKIERTWTIINWCTYNTNLPCVYIPNPNPNPTANSTQNLPGPIVSAPGTPAPWGPTKSKVNPTDAQQLDYSVFYTGGTYTDYGTGQTVTVPGIASTNCLVYKQIIKVIDTQDPVVENCPDSLVEVCDLTVNNPQLWNEMYWWDAVTEGHDLCEGPTDLSITTTDACTGASVNIRYLLFLDTDGDGTMETAVSSTNLPAAGTVNYGNASNPNFSGGEVRVYDQRGVPQNQKYNFAIQTSLSGNKKVASLKWNTQSAPNTYVTPELPYGTHKIKWIVEDGCGNETVCEYSFKVKDCKAPTVVCYNGLSVNIMATGMIQLWASDFLNYAEDNCTPPTPYTSGDKLRYAIRKSGQGTGFPVDAQGQPVTSVTFTCDEIGTQPVELWAMDLAGNAAYCETYVIVQDPDGICSPNGNATVAGFLETEPLAGSDGVEDASIDLQGSHPALPPVSMFDLTNTQGYYAFGNALPLGSDYTVTPVKDDNPMNGVSTFDLVLISKHILGTDPLNSPYKIIAADANKSNSVTTFDILELRKLILGIYTELPNNTSWRFLDEGFAFSDPSNPFYNIPFAENISVGDIQSNQIDENFVGVKIGDVNGSVISNATQQAEDRTAGTLLLDVLTPSPSPNGEGSADREVKAGEVFDVTFRTAEQVQGFQFTLNLNGLKVEDIVKSDKVGADNFGVFQDALTTSIDGAAEFTVRFRAEKAGKLSEMLQLSSRITRAEAYNANAQNLEVALRFSGQTIAGVGFELYQNQPNPWMNRTQIGFHLPQATTATLTVYDETGRVLFTQKGDFAKGYNAISLDRAMLNTTGVLYYKLETATDSATKKMIQTR
ncbi:MAG: SdrD B-like domain-containing protein [Saprospiraceae bacterium]